MSILAHPRPLTPFTRHTDSHHVAVRAAPHGQAVDGRAEPSEVCHWDDSRHPDYEPDN